MKANQDGTVLLGLIKTIVHHFKNQKFLLLVLYNAKLNLYSFHQGNLSNTEYLRKFNNIINIATSYDGKLHDTAIHNIVIKVDYGMEATYTALSNNEKTAANKCANDLYCAAMFIAQADKCCYGKLQEELKNMFTWGN